MKAHAHYGELRHIGFLFELDDFVLQPVQVGESAFPGFEKGSSFLQLCSNIPAPFDIGQRLSPRQLKPNEIVDSP